MKKINYTLIVLLILISSISAFGQQFKVMVYTGPDRWHDRSIPIAITEFKEMAIKHHFELVWAQKNGSGSLRDPFSTEFLEGVDAIVFLNSKGEDLTETQKENFKTFIRNGGGFVGIHGASANRGQEEWFRKLVGITFTDHPEEQTAVMNVVDKNFPATMHLQDKWIWTDEWYSYGEPLTDNIKMLLTVDERTYDPDRTWGNPNRFTAMGDYHPIAWYQEFDGGRSFYTTLGHIPEAFKDPWFLAHIYGGIYWAATGLGITE